MGDLFYIRACDPLLLIFLKTWAHTLITSPELRMVARVFVGVHHPALTSKMSEHGYSCMCTLVDIIFRTETIWNPTHGARTRAMKLLCGKLMHFLWQAVFAPSPSSMVGILNNVDDDNDDTTSLPHEETWRVFEASCISGFEQKDYRSAIKQ